MCKGPWKGWELFVFLCGFLKQPIRVGTGLQSSHFLLRRFERLLDEIELSNGCVAELGAGLGRLTERILKRLGPETRLLCVEMEPMFALHLRRKFAHDPRVTVIQDRAENLPLHLERLRIGKLGTVISTVPLNSRKKEALLAAVRLSLKEGGRLVQMALTRRRGFERHFDYLGRRVILWNFPPEILHICEKRTRRAAAFGSGAQARTSAPV